MLNKIKELSKKTKVILLAVCLIVIAGVGSVITACTNAKPDDGADENKAVATESATEPTEKATEAATELPTEETEEPTEQATENPTEEVTEQPTEKSTEKKDKSESDKDEDKDKENKNDNEENTIVTTTTTTGGNQTNNNNNTNNNTSTGNNTTNNNTQTNTNTNNNTTTNNNTGSTTSKVWHEAEYKTVHHPAETKKVWVVDQEGYTYEEPIYEEHGRTICNNCEIDITENCMAHMKEHALNRESASYRSETREIQVGTKTVTVEEKGHWETQIVKEAWDEQVLVREAGYY